jgi:outer membrane protein assembly factor BamB
VQAVNAASAAPARLGEGEQAAAVRIAVYNNSPAGYNSVEIASFTVRLLDQDQAPLDTAKARNLFQSVSLVQDSPGGLSGVYESGIDLGVATVTINADLVLAGGGALTLSVPSVSAARTPAASTAAYYVVFEAAQYASTQAPNAFSVNFDPAADLVLRDAPSFEPQAFTPGSAVQTSSTVIMVPAAPPPGTFWPYAPSTQQGVVSLADYYNGDIVSSSVYITSLDGVLRAVRADGQGKWEFQTFPVSPVRTAPLFKEESGGVYLYFADDYGDIYKIRDNEASAQQIWKRQLGAKVVSNPVDSGAKLYFGADNARVYCLNKADGSDCAGWTYDAGFTASVSGTISLDDRTPGVNASWIGLEDGKVVRFRTADGTISSAFQTGGPIKTSPYADAAYLGGNNVYVTSTDGKIYARTSANLTTKPSNWQDFNSGAPIYTSPFKDQQDGKSVYFGNDAGRLYKVDASSGELVMSFQAGGPIRSSPVMVPADYSGLGAGEDYVYFGCDDGYIYAVNTHTGQLRDGWPVPTGGPVRADVNVDLENLTLIVGSSDGKTYVFYIGPP